MPISIAFNIKTSAQALSNTSSEYWSNIILDRYGIVTHLNPDVYDSHVILRQIYYIFKLVHPSLIKDCGVSKLFIRNDMGPNKPYYPNHGYYSQGDDSITLNADIFYHPDLPDDFIDCRGYFLTRGYQTLLHELGHGYDYVHGEISLKNPWLSLSGWSETYMPGLKRIRIRDSGSPEVVGEWFYNPSAGFTRFYSKRNPWDDFADSFAFYMAGMKNKLPPNKSSYFAALYKKYSS